MIQLRSTRRWLAILFLFAIGISSCVAAESCVDCHKKSNHTLVMSWQESRHAAKGVDCIACHGDNHSGIFAVKGEVSAGVCARCHEKQAKEFSQSLHAIAFDKMKADPKFARLSPAMAELSCVGCHQIGKRFSDGSQGKCNSCHSGHSFSVIEARRPEACAQCHTGADHPQLEAWQTSKHGQLFATEATRAQAPTCVTCHLPKGNHNTAVGLTLGNVANGATLETNKPAVKMRSLSVQETTLQRESMLKTCLPCHSSRLASESLRNADLVKQEADALLGEAAGIIQRLHAEGLLKRPGLAADHEKLKMATHGTTALILGVDQLYEGLSPAEQRFFNMAKFHHATTFKGAYHHSPLHTHNQGFLLMKQDLDFIKNEEIRARTPISTTKP